MSVLTTADSVAVIGAGTMGAGVAQVAAAAGHPTLLYDNDPQAVDKALQILRQRLDRSVDRGRMDAAKRDQLLGNLRPVTELEALAPAKLVIEAIIEELAIKRSLFLRLEAICDPACILASNTSSLSISAIASPLARPERLVGMHFFNPAPVMQLVEVVSGIATEPEIAERVRLTAENWGKRPVLTKSTPGFIVNRVARPFYAEALRLLEEGAADCASIDAVTRGSGGFPMGPFELMDLIGHDVNYAVTRSVFDAFYQDPRFLPSLLQKELVDGGRLGRKSGRGFYRYPEGAPNPETFESADTPPPRQIEIRGDLGPADSLIPLWQAAGIRVDRVGGNENAILLDDARLALTDGRSASRYARDIGARNSILFDLALDYSQAERIALAPADQASSAALNRAAGLFRALGKQVSVFDDVPGLCIMRMVCMLANEAAEAVLQQVCTAQAVDTAMHSGVNYPLGPLAWADRLSPKLVLGVLENLQQAYGLDRYRPSRLLRRKVEAGTHFHDR